MTTRYRNADALEEFFGEQITVPASNGTRRSYNIPPGATRLMIEPTAAMRMQYVPAIRQVWFYDASQTGSARWIDLARPVVSAYHNTTVPTLINGARDASAAYPGSTLGTLFSMTSSDFVYVAVSGRIGGLYAEVSGANDQNQALSVAYSQGAFASIGSITDGTNSSGTLAQDGAITWTTPGVGNWNSLRLNDILKDSTMPVALSSQPKMFWLRLSVAGTLGTATALDYLAPLHLNAMGGAESNEGGNILKADVEYTADIGRNVGALEILAQAASATTAQVTWMRRP